MRTITPDHRLRRLAAFLLVAAAAACTTVRTEPSGGDLGAGQWRLVELNGRAALPADPARHPTLQFAPDSSRASGNGGCNGFGGPYTHEGPTLRFGSLMSTMRACADDALTRQEGEYLAALRATDRYEIAADTLTLLRGTDRLARLVR